mgnify:CR=1 FL=1
MRSNSLIGPRTLELRAGLNTRALEEFRFGCVALVAGESAPPTEQTIEPHHVLRGCVGFQKSDESAGREWTPLETDALRRLAVIVRGADTGRPDLAPQSAGLLAASLGLSRLYSDDLEQLEAGMALYDAFYRWCRDATDEPHNWPATKSGQAS